MNHYIPQILLMGLLIWALGYVCYCRGRATGIREGRIDEREFNTRRAVMQNRSKRNWQGQN